MAEAEQTHLLLSSSAQPLPGVPFPKYLTPSGAMTLSALAVHHATASLDSLPGPFFLFMPAKTLAHRAWKQSLCVPRRPCTRAMPSWLARPLTFALPRPILPIIPLIDTSVTVQKLKRLKVCFYMLLMLYRIYTCAFLDVQKSLLPGIYYLNLKHFSPNSKKTYVLFEPPLSPTHYTFFHFVPTKKLGWNWSHHSFKLILLCLCHKFPSELVSGILCQ